MNGAYDDVRIIALQLLRRVVNPTQEDIWEKIKKAMQTVEVTEKDFDVEALRIDIEAGLNVWVRAGGALDSTEPHVEWLTDTMSFIAEERAKTDWQFWRRYERYLREVRRRPESVIRALDRNTTTILKRLEDPTRRGDWDRRGMVVGSVQSGKTSNFTGLICKAADAGYKIIVVLSGLYNNLRAQTQFRLDEEFLGQESDKGLVPSEQNRIGVAKLYAERHPIAHWLTNSSEKGDFSLRVQIQAGVTPGGDPILFVVKKNVSILKNLNAWMRTAPQVEGGKVRGLPMLVIDDECDLASINTKVVESADADEYDVTAINREIRTLLHSFERVAYVGYTATPFASIFIDPDRPHAEYGEDVFPRSFIVSLPQPSDYIGPVEVFGLDADPSLATQDAEGQPIVRPVDDYADLIPDGHDKELVVKDLPDSMKVAIKAFILACAIRRFRGQGNQHCSMLIHVSRYVSVQKQLTEKIREELEKLQNRIRYHDGARGRGESGIYEGLRRMWDEDFVPTTRKMRPAAAIATWNQIVPHIEPASSKIAIKTINGTIQDVLDYRMQKDGLSVIVIGGDKLSRGLTLEGLVVSYYLRAANMYDTLMQMGRWFGYRLGYEDLCRIYTTQDLIHLYRWIAMATDELRRDFAQMEEIGATPNDFGLRVRMHPGRILITSLNKMRAGTRLPVSYADHMIQTLGFHKDPRVIERNIRVTERFIQALKGPNQAAGAVRTGHFWTDVPVERVLEFLSTFTVHPDNPPEVNSELIVRYINTRVEDGELTRWTVALVGGDGATITLGGLSVSSSMRKPPDNVSSTREDKVTLNGLTSPVHEAADLTEAQYESALAVSVARWNFEAERGEGSRRSKEPPKVPRPKDIRALRSPTHGLLLLYPIDLKSSKWEVEGCPIAIGFGVSFPPSDNAMAKPIHYMVNKRYLDDFI
jgi:hypothetical protein